MKKKTAIITGSGVAGAALIGAGAYLLLNNKKKKKGIFAGAEKPCECDSNCGADCACECHEAATTEAPVEG